MNKRRWLSVAASVLLMGGAVASNSAVSAQQLPQGQVRFFTMIDADKDGVIAKAEYVAYREAQFALHDGNKDGAIAREEFLAKSPGRGAESRFQPLDKDGDGKVTKAEWAAETESMFAGRDVNKDGKLTPDEMGPMRMMRRP